MKDKDLRLNSCLSSLVTNKDLPILSIVTSQYLSGTRENVGISIGIGVGIGIGIGVLVLDTTLD